MTTENKPSEERVEAGAKAAAYWAQHAKSPEDWLEVARIILAAADAAGAQQAAPSGEAVVWLVLDRNGLLMHAAAWREAAHEHINDAINEHGLTEAAQWVVRPAYTHPAPAPAAVPAGYALVDKRDLFDVVRSAYFNGANNDGADEAALHSDAHDYALRCKLLAAMLSASPPPSTERGCDEAMRKDAERLDWLEAMTHRGYAPQVVYDDNGNWAVSFDGVMPIPQADPPDEPLMVSARVEPHEWRATARAAIDAAMSAAPNQKGALNERE